MSDDLSAFSMEELFRMEAETQCTVLSDALVALESSPDAPSLLAALMRAAHSLKGAARIIGMDDAVKIAHAMEDAFALGQKGALRFSPEAIDLMLRGVDLLRALAAGTPVDGIPGFLDACARLVSESAPAVPAVAETPPEPVVESVDRAAGQSLRVDADKLDRVLGFSGESVVAARRLAELLTDTRRLVETARSAAGQLSALRPLLAQADGAFDACRESLESLRAGLDAQYEDIDAFSRAWNVQADRLYNEALVCRMRPLADLLPPLRRLVRDLSRELGKSAVLEVVGENTPVDREILEQLEAPLAHLIRNSLDHGIEDPSTRRAKGKPETGSIRIDARHLGGHLAITLADDGGGVDIEALRRSVVARGLASAETGDAMSDAEVLDFLFLPGFSMRDAVTEISGRGVGLDVVQTAARAVRGSVRARANVSSGLSFELGLPISLSVIHSLVAQIGGEPYAFPLARVGGVLRVSAGDVESTEGRQYFRRGEERIALVSAALVLGVAAAPVDAETFPVLLLEERESVFGLVVDAFAGEQELVVQPLDACFGKIPGVSAASILPDGSPVLIADTGDFAAAMERLSTGGGIRAVEAGVAAAEESPRRVLVVEDSLTVRELERKLLTDRGYEVSIAVDGMDGWTAARAGGFDLVITDVDMPRMDGIELTRMIKADPRLCHTPVMIVSYKDRPEDRRRGLDAGADYYLTKGGFQDRSLLNAVADLLGDTR